MPCQKSIMHTEIVVAGEHDGTLLGNRGYPCRRCLLMPYQNPVGRHQEKLNNALTCTRVKVEQAFGILERKFACPRYLRLSPKKACPVITATVILHDIAVDYGNVDDEGDLSNQPQETQSAPGNGDDLVRMPVRLFVYIIRRHGRTRTIRFTFYVIACLRLHCPIRRSDFAIFPSTPV